MGVSGDCLGLCKAASQDYISGVLGKCDDHVLAVIKCRRRGSTGNSRFCKVAYVRYILCRHIYLYHTCFNIAFAYVLTCIL